MIALAIRHAKCFDQIERVLKMAGCQTDDQGTEVRSPVNEEALLLKFVKPMSAFRKAIHNVPVIPCVSCSLLLRQTDVQPFDSSEHVYVAPGSVGQRLVKFLQEQNERSGHTDRPCFFCVRCCDDFRKGVLPHRSVLNHLVLDPVPDELSCLNMFERSLVQLVKLFQTCVRLGTSSCQRPFPERVKASHSLVVHLPLPLMSNIAEVQKMPPLSEEHPVIVNCLPTKAKLLWQYLVR